MRPDANLCETPSWRPEQDLALCYIAVLQDNRHAFELRGIAAGTPHPLGLFLPQSVDSRSDRGNRDSPRLGPAIAIQLGTPPMIGAHGNHGRYWRSMRPEKAAT
jgi:hypothetical protein